MCSEGRSGGRGSVHGQGTTFDASLNRRNTEHSFTTETPTIWQIEKRVRVQLHWLQVALELISAD